MSIIITAIVLAIFFLPVYSPFIFSFAFRSQDWRELRIALRPASAIAFFIVLGAVPACPYYGNDVAGSMRGALYNIICIWGSGIISVGICVPAVICLRSVRKRDRRSRKT